MTLQEIPHSGRKPGRPPGAKNRISRDVKIMVLDALDELGGKEYLKTQASGSNASAFMTLIGKIIPTQIGNIDGESFKTETSLPTEDKEILNHWLKTKGKP